MIRKLKNSTNFIVLMILVLITVLSLALSAVSRINAGTNDWWSWADGAFQNFSTEMMGAIATFALFELVVGSRNEKRKLIIQMRSSDNITALNAVAQITANGWLRDGSLQNLALGAANLQGANLNGVNLQGGGLIGANVQGAALHEANLQGMLLWKANLQGADLRRANLQGADLAGANLQGAYLANAHLDNVKWALNDGTNRATLPDGTIWTAETDMKRFTNTEHLEYKSTLDTINEIREKQGRTPY